jgi:AcrR family transcriptional regulator
VPMATIAAEAGVGIGTLYRHFPSREALLEFLTHRSFERVLGNALAAQESGRPAAESLRRFIDAAIAQRNELVLPLHGGPPVVAPRTQALQRQVHSTIEAIIARGRDDGTIAGSVTAREVVTFGAMLAQPRPADPAWDALTRRLLDTYVAGLGVEQPTTRRGS